MEKKILITSFDPFGGESFNASAAVAKAMPEKIGSIPAEKITLPVEFGRSAELALEAARETGASLLVLLGEARTRKAVTPELVAINHAYAQIPDNAGKMPSGEPIVENGAAAYFTDFPARRLAELIKANGVNSTLSYSAGVYVCNELYYRILSELCGSSTRAVFVHIPRAEREEGYREMARAISAALAEILCLDAVPKM